MLLKFYTKTKTNYKMNEFLGNLISTIIQIGIFTLIPFVFFQFRKDKTQTFKKYIGFYKPTGKSIFYVLLTSLLVLISGIILVLTNTGIKEAVFAPNSVTGQIKQMGFSVTSILTLLIIALFKTSLAEEILFRGFIAKRLTNKLGFKIGNILQALIFGIIHLILFWGIAKTTIIPLIIIFSLTTIAGWTIGMVKEKYANGSIIPGWVGHGIGNVLAYFIIAFILK